MHECDVAIITGSGFYDFPELENGHEVEIATTMVLCVNIWQLSLPNSG